MIALVGNPSSGTVPAKTDTLFDSTQIGNLCSQKSAQLSGRRDARLNMFQQPRFLRFQENDCPCRGLTTRSLCSSVIPAFHDCITGLMRFCRWIRRRAAPVIGCWYQMRGAFLLQQDPSELSSAAPCICVYSCLGTI